MCKLTLCIYCFLYQMLPLQSQQTGIWKSKLNMEIKESLSFDTFATVSTKLNMECKISYNFQLGYCTCWALSLYFNVVLLPQIYFHIGENKTKQSIVYSTDSFGKMLLSCHSSIFYQLFSKCNLQYLNQAFLSACSSLCSCLNIKSLG